jgi:hypothetical protein
MHPISALKLENMFVDATGFEPATPACKFKKRIWMT